MRGNVALRLLRFRRLDWHQPGPACCDAADELAPLSRPPLLLRHCGIYRPGSNAGHCAARWSVANFFGTDYPFGDQAPKGIADRLLTCGFTQAELRGIDRENAVRVLPKC